MWLVEIDSDGLEVSDVFPAGTCCGAKLLGITSGSKSQKEIKINELARQQVNAKIREIMAQFKEVVKRQFDGFRICTNYIKQNYSDYIMG